jgi:hypothetical protein
MIQSVCELYVNRAFDIADFFPQTYKIQKTVALGRQIVAHGQSNV